MNKFREGWRNYNPLRLWQKASTVTKVLIVVSALQALTLLFMFKVLEGPHSSVPARAPEPEYQDLVRRGDFLFTDYEYEDALEAYQQADRMLDSLIKFESESPTKSMNILQAYYNSKSFIKTRIQLTLIADDISKLDH